MNWKARKRVSQSFHTQNGAKLKQECLISKKISKFTQSLNLLRNHKRLFYNPHPQLKIKGNWKQAHKLSNLKRGNLSRVKIMKLWLRWTISWSPRRYWKIQVRMHRCQNKLLTYPKTVATITHRMDSLTLHKFNHKRQFKVQINHWESKIHREITR